MDDLTRQIRAILPGAVFDVDNEGQIIIYTDKRETDDGGIADFIAE